jgi:predicted transcriptional regulator
MIERVQRETREAASASRDLARDLRKAGLSVSDTAAVLGVSRGRVSQLSSEPEVSDSPAPARRQKARQNRGRGQEVRDWQAKRERVSVEDSTVVAAKD